MTAPNGIPPRFESAAAVERSLRAVGYLPDHTIARVVHLADRLHKPVLIEGPAGTGKTQLAKSVALMTGAPLIRLQCYEGLDEAKALYEWDYRKQLMHIQMYKGDSDENASSDLVSCQVVPPTNMVGSGIL
jgi:MoxR-like ATPase